MLFRKILITMAVDMYEPTSYDEFPDSEDKGYTLPPGVYGEEDVLYFTRFPGYFKSNTYSNHRVKKLVVGDGVLYAVSGMCVCT